MATVLKTIMKLDDRNWKSALKSVNEAIGEYADTFRETSKDTRIELERTLQVKKDISKKITDLEADITEQKRKLIYAESEDEEKAIKKKMKNLRLLRSIEVDNLKVARENSSKQMAIMESEMRTALEHGDALERNRQRQEERNKQARERARIQDAVNLAEEQRNNQTREDEARDLWDFRMNLTRRRQAQTERESNERLAEQRRLGADMASAEESDYRERLRLQDEFTRRYENNADEVHQREITRLRDLHSRNVISSTQLARAEEETNRARDESIDRLDRQTQSTESLANATIRYLRWAGTIAGLYYAISQSWDVTLGKGIEVNKMIESQTYGIAALISANTKMTDSLGNTLDPMDKFIMGQRLAKDALKDLRIESLKTPATMAELTSIYQQAIGQTLSMGSSFGSTVEDISKNTIKLASRLSNLGGSVGMEMDRIREEIRSMLSGNASTDSLLSTMLFGSPSETNKAIKLAKDRGENGVKDLLDTMLKPFDVLANTQTYEKGRLAMVGAWEIAMSDMVEKSGMFQDITDLFYDMAENITDNTDDIVDGFDNIYNGVVEVSDALENVLVAGAAVGLSVIIAKTTASVFGLTAAVNALTAASLRNPWIVGAIATGTAIYTVSEWMSEEADRIEDVRKIMLKEDDEFYNESNNKLKQYIKDLEENNTEIRTKMQEVSTRMKSGGFFYDADDKNEDQKEYDKLKEELKLSSTKTKVIKAQLALQNKALGIVDETNKKQKEHAKLLTKVSLSKKAIELSDKVLLEDDTKIEAIDKKILEINKGLADEKKKLNLLTNQDAKSQKLLNDAIEKYGKAIESLNKQKLDEQNKIKTEEAKNRNTILKSLIEVEIAKNKSLNIDFKSSEYTKKKIDSLNKLLLTQKAGSKERRDTQIKIYNETAKRNKELKTEEEKARKEKEKSDRYALDVAKQLIINEISRNKLKGDTSNLEIYKKELQEAKKLYDKQKEQGDDRLKFLIAEDKVINARLKVKKEEDRLGEKARKDAERDLKDAYELKELTLKYYSERSILQSQLNLINEKEENLTSASIKLHEKLADIHGGKNLIDMKSKKDLEAEIKLLKAKQDVIEDTAREKEKTDKAEQKRLDAAIKANEQASKKTTGLFYNWENSEEAKGMNEKIMLLVEEGEAYEDLLKLYNSIDASKSTFLGFSQEDFVDGTADALTGAIQQGIDGDFDFSIFAKGIGDSIGSSLLSAGMSQIGSDFMSAESGAGLAAIGAGGGLWGAAAGVGVSLLASQLGQQGATAEEVEAKDDARIEKQTDAIVSALELQSTIESTYGSTMKSLALNQGVANTEYLGDILDALSGSKRVDIAFGLASKTNKEKYTHIEQVESIGVLFETFDGAVGSAFDAIKHLAIHGYTDLRDFETATDEYITSTLENASQYVQFTDQLKSIYETAGGTKYQDELIASATSRFSDKQGGDFTGYIEISIENLKALDATIGELSTDLQSEDLEKQVKAVVKLNEAMGMDFSEAQDAIDYLDELQVYGESFAEISLNTENLKDELELLNAKDDATRIAIEQGRELAKLQDESNKRLQEEVWAKEAQIKSDANMQSYYDSFLTDEHKLQNQLPTGSSLATTYEELNALASLMEKSGGEFTDAELSIIASNKAIIDSNGEVAKTNKEVSEEKSKTLSDELEILNTVDEATKTRILRERELALLIDNGNIDLQKAIWAKEDYLRLQEEELQLNEEKLKLEDELNRIGLETNELRKLDLATMDDALKSTQKAIWAKEDAIEAEEELTRARLEAVEASMSLAVISKNAEQAQIDFYNQGMANTLQWVTRNETIEEKANRLANTLGITVASSMDELELLAVDLADSNFTLQDSQLEFLEVNDELIKSNNEAADEILSANMEIIDSNRELSITMKEGIIDSIDSIISSLTDSSTESSVGGFNRAMLELVSSTDDATQELALQGLSTNVSALQDTSNFISQSSMMYAQALAKNQLMKIQESEQKELTILEVTQNLVDSVVGYTFALSDSIEATAELSDANQINALLLGGYQLNLGADRETTVSDIASALNQSYGMLSDAELEVLDKLDLNTLSADELEVLNGLQLDTLAAEELETLQDLSLDWDTDNVPEVLTNLNDDGGITVSYDLDDDQKADLLLQFDADDKLQSIIDNTGNALTNAQLTALGLAKDSSVIADTTIVGLDTLAKDETLAGSADSSLTSYLKTLVSLQASQIEKDTQAFSSTYSYGAGYTLGSQELSDFVQASGTTDTSVYDFVNTLHTVGNEKEDFSSLLDYLGVDTDDYSVANTDRYSELLGLKESGYLAGDVASVVDGIQKGQDKYDLYQLIANQYKMEERAASSMYNAIVYAIDPLLTFLKNPDASMDSQEMKLVLNESDNNIHSAFDISLSDNVYSLYDDLYDRYVDTNLKALDLINPISSSDDIHDILLKLEKELDFQEQLEDDSYSAKIEYLNKSVGTSVLGYSTGGYTGDIGISDIAGVVHGQEYVVNAKTTKDLGLNNGDGGVFNDIIVELKELRKEIVLMKSLQAKQTSNSKKQLDTQRQIQYNTIA